METRRTFLQRSALVAAAPLVLGTQAATARTVSNTPLNPRSADPRWNPLESAVQHRFVTNKGVRLHYVLAGSGPLVVFVHGFPGWWWTWRKQMAPLMDRYTVAALDMRGYADSGKPKATSAYAATALAGDVAAVIRDAGFSDATIVGHDFGGSAAWVLAGLNPALVRRLVVLNSPHPAILMRQLRERPKQARAFRYAQALRRPDAPRRPLPKQFLDLFPPFFQNGARTWSPEVVGLMLSQYEVPDFPTHLLAARRTSIRAAFKYYAAIIPATPYPKPPPEVEGLRAGCPTLMLWGMKDVFLLPQLMDDTERYVDGPLELERIENADHFVHNQQPELVSAKLADWLARTEG